MITAHIIVTPKRSVLDPQGEAVKKALLSLGLDSVAGTRVGKFIELELNLDAAETDQIRKKLESVCLDLLSNPVIEDYQISLATQSTSPAPAAVIKEVTPPQAEYEGLDDQDEESVAELVKLEIKPKKALKKLLKAKDEDTKSPKDKKKKKSKSSPATDAKGKKKSGSGKK